MPHLCFLDIQYNLSKLKFLKKFPRLFPGLFPIYLPNTEELNHIFNIFDSNKDGKISLDEFKVVLKALERGNHLPTTKEIKKIFEVADLDGDGFINFNEFVQVLKEAGGVEKDDLRRAFQAFDENNDGKITAGELHEFLIKLGERCSLQDCQRMVKAVDRNGDGVIDSKEFMTMMTRTLTKHYPSMGMDT